VIVTIALFLAFIDLLHSCVSLLSTVISIRKNCWWLTGDDFVYDHVAFVPDWRYISCCCVVEWFRGPHLQFTFVPPALHLTWCSTHGVHSRLRAFHYVHVVVRIRLPPPPFCSILRWYFTVLRSTYKFPYLSSYVVDFTNYDFVGPFLLLDHVWFSLPFSRFVTFSFGYVTLNTVWSTFHVTGTPLTVTCVRRRFYFTDTPTDLPFRFVWTICVCISFVLAKKRFHSFGCCCIFWNVRYSISSLPTFIPFWFTLQLWSFISLSVNPVGGGIWPLTLFCYDLQTVSGVCLRWYYSFVGERYGCYRWWPNTHRCCYVTVSFHIRSPFSRYFVLFTFTVAPVIPHHRLHSPPFPFDTFTDLLLLRSSFIHTFQPIHFGVLLPIYRYASLTWSIHSILHHDQMIHLSLDYFWVVCSVVTVWI